MLHELWQAGHTLLVPQHICLLCHENEGTLTWAVYTTEPPKVVMNFAFSGGLAAGWCCFRGIVGFCLLPSLLDVHSCPGIWEEKGVHHVCMWAGNSHPATYWRGTVIKNELVWPFQALLLCLKLDQIAISEAKNNKFLWNIQWTKLQLSKINRPSKNEP